MFNKRYIYNVPSSTIRNGLNQTSINNGIEK